MVDNGVKFSFDANKYVANLNRARMNFPQNGKFVLNRSNLVTSIRQALRAYQSVPNFTGGCSVYIYGMKASGKTSLLNLLASDFQKDNYLVYFFKSLTKLNSFKNIAKEMLSVDSSIGVVIIVDDLQCCREYGYLNSLLKTTRDNTIVIGAAIPPTLESGITGCFNIKISSQLLLSSNCEEMCELINYWKAQVASISNFDMSSLASAVVETGSDQDAAIANSTVVDICEYIREYCGGHFFLTVLFMEMAFTLPPEHRTSVDTFKVKFHSSDFCSTPRYYHTVQRSFDITWEKDLTESMMSVLRGLGSFQDFSVLERK